MIVRRSRRISRRMRRRRRGRGGEGEALALRRILGLHSYRCADIDVRLSYSVVVCVGLMSEPGHRRSSTSASYSQCLLLSSSYQLPECGVLNFSCSCKPRASSSRLSVTQLGLRCGLLLTSALLVYFPTSRSNSYSRTSELYLRPEGTASCSDTLVAHLYTLVSRVSNGLRTSTPYIQQAWYQC